MSNLEKLKTVLLLLMACFSTSSSAGSDDIQTRHMVQIEKWLSVHTEFRLANLHDCVCDERINEIREGDGGMYKPQPNYLPFYAVGNFNGVSRFAVIVLKKQIKFHAKILVFSEVEAVPPIIINYPFAHDDSLEYVGFFVQHRGRKLDDLLIGTFNSEAQLVVLPKQTKK